MKLIVGLGNPGRSYAGTRHNMGAQVVKTVAKQLGISLTRRSLNAEWVESRRGNKHMIIARPTTYMNQSGLCVAALANYFRIPPADLLIVVDDLHLPLGSLRFRSQGSAGGHNGLKSIIQHLGHQDFHRLRVGIGTAPEGMEITDYVLGRFADDEIDLLNPVLERAAQGVLSWIDHGIEAAMQQHN